MNSSANKDMDSAEAAGLWDARLRAPDCTNADRAAHEDWKNSGPANARAFDGLQKIIEDLPAIAFMPEIQSLREAALSRSQQEITPELKPTNWFAIGGAIAASLAVVLVSTLLMLQTRNGFGDPKMAANTDAPAFATAIGERADIPLTDGTTATLNTDSEIDVRYSADERAIHLVRGEAHFDVAHKPDRPFVVYAGKYKVIAIGTAFDVKAVGDTVDVVVTEGKVEVKRFDPDGQKNIQPGAMLVAGQQFSARPTGPGFRRTADLATSTSWRQGNAVFEDTPLLIAAQEMNRYSAVKLTITDSQLANTKINGMFITGNQDSFVAALEAYFGVTAKYVSDTEIHLESSAR